MQAIVDPTYRIDFPSIKNSDLVAAMQLCLQRDSRKRPTAQQLLEDSFLNPHQHSAQTLPTPVSVSKEGVIGLSQADLFALVQHVTKQSTVLTPRRLTSQIFSHLQSQSAVPSAPTPVKFVRWSTHICIADFFLDTKAEGHDAYSLKARSRPKQPPTAGY